MIIDQNTAACTRGEESNNLIQQVSDATIHLQDAVKYQKSIGWNNRFKGRWTRHWASILNYDVLNNESGILHSSSEKNAKEIILHNWDYMYDMWKARNITEHDFTGNPETRRKEKMIEKIVDNYEKININENSNDELI
jgi:hypothetical protein